VISRTKLTETGDLNDEFGINTVTHLKFFPPVIADVGFGTNLRATATIEIEGYTGLKASFNMIVFTYPPATIDLFSPNQGVLDGGTLIQCKITDPSGIETKEGAGYVHFGMASVYNTQVSFTGAAGSVNGKVEQVTHGGDTVIIKVRSPNMGGVRMLTPVKFFVSGVLMKTNKEVSFQFRTEYLASVLPASGLNLGGSRISMIVMGVSTESSKTGVSATIQNNPCTSLTSSFSVAGRISITCTLSAALNFVGKANIMVSWREGTTTLSVTSPDLFTYVALPDLQIVQSSVVVGNSSPDLAVVITGSPTKVTFTLKFIGSGDTPTVKIGGLLAT
jgi:hypothetical protein